MPTWSQLRCLLQSLDTQPEQLALRPKEFFRAHGIEVLTEAQVRTRQGNGAGPGFRNRAGYEAPGRAGVFALLALPLRPQDAPGLEGSWAHTEPQCAGMGTSVQGWSLGA